MRSMSLRVLAVAALLFAAFAGQPKTALAFEWCGNITGAPSCPMSPREAAQSLCILAYPNCAFLWSCEDSTTIKCWGAMQ